MAQPSSPFSREEKKARTKVAREVLRKHFSSLINSLSVEDVLPTLFSQGIITNYEHQSIKSKSTSFDKAESLLNCLRKKSYHEFEVFCKVLGSSIAQDEASELVEDYHQGLLGESISVEQPFIYKRRKQLSQDEAELLERIECLKAGSTELIINRLHASGSFQHLSWHEVLSKLREIKILTDDEESIFNNPLAVPSVKENALVRCLVRNGPIHGLKKFCEILIETRQQQSAHSMILDSITDEVRSIIQDLSLQSLPEHVSGDREKKKEGSSSQSSHHEPSTGAPMKAVGSGTEPTPELPSPQSVSSQHNPKHVLINQKLFGLLNKSDNEKILQELKSSEVDISFLDESSGETCLHLAVNKKMTAVLRVMVHHVSFRLGVQNKDGDTALHCAASVGSSEMVHVLCEAAISDLPQVINITNKGGNTALHCSCRGGHAEVSQVLLFTYHCQPHIRNKDNHTPIQVAVEQGHMGIVQLIHKYTNRGEQEDPEEEYSTPPEEEPEIEVRSKAKQARSSSLESELVLPTTLYGYLMIKKDKVEKMRAVQVSGVYRSATDEENLVEMREEVKILREKCSTQQKRISHLELQLQKYHIKEAVKSEEGKNVDMDEEHEQRKYSRMEKETLVEEILHMKRFLIKFENLSLEGKAHAQRYSAELEVEKSKNEALKDTFNISRDLWEKRIRDQSDTVRKLQDKVNQLEGVIAKKKKQKGLTKEEEQILQLPQVLVQGAGLIIEKFKLAQRETEIERTKLRQQPEPRPAPSHRPKELTFEGEDEGSQVPPQGMKHVERPQPVGITPEPSPPVQSLPMPSPQNWGSLPKLITGAVGSLKQLLDLLQSCVCVQMSVANVVMIEPSNKPISLHLLQKALQHSARSSLPSLKPPLGCLQYSLTMTGTSSTVIGPLERGLAPLPTDELQLASSSLLGQVLAYILHQIVPSMSLHDIANLSDADLTALSKGYAPIAHVKGSAVNEESVLTHLTKKLKVALSYSQQLPTRTQLPGILNVHSLPLEVADSAHRAACNIIPLLYPMGSCVVVRAIDGAGAQAAEELPKADPVVPAHIDSPDPPLIAFLGLLNFHRQFISDVDTFYDSRAILASIHSRKPIENELVEKLLKRIQQHACDHNCTELIASKILPYSSERSDAPISSILHSLNALVTKSLPTKPFLLKWIFLLEILMEVDRKWLDIKAVQLLATRYCDMSPEEVLVALQYFKEGGHLMFYPECLELKKFVVIDRSVVLNALLTLCQLQDEKSLPNGILEECLLQSIWSSVSLPMDKLVALMEHLCIFADVTEGRPSAQHKMCRSFLIPALLNLEPEILPSQGDPEDKPPMYSSFSQGVTLPQMNSPLFVTSPSPVLQTCFIAALCQVLSQKSKDYRVYLAARNQLCFVLGQHSIVVLVQIFGPGSELLGGVSGIRLDVGFTTSQMASVIPLVVDACRAIEKGHGYISFQCGTVCPNSSDSLVKHLLKLSNGYSHDPKSGQFIAECAVCRTGVEIESVQQFMFDSYLTAVPMLPVIVAPSVSKELCKSELIEVSESLNVTSISQVMSLGKVLHFTSAEIKVVTEFSVNDPKDSITYLLLLWYKKATNRSGAVLAEALYKCGFTNQALKIDQETVERLVLMDSHLILSPPLTKSELQQVSLTVQDKWERLCRRLRFDDFDYQELSDLDGEEACLLVLTQWLESKPNDSRRALISALTEMGHHLLAHKLHT